MIIYKKGNIVNDEAEALVNSVNTVGVMGKGVALAFKKAFPQNYKIYKQACDNNELRTGKLLITQTGQFQPKYIINFPTKVHWRNPSKYEYIEEGLKELVRIIRIKNIKSIAIPPLGAGNGKLEWDKVKHLIEKYLSQFKNIKINVYEPSFIPKENNKKQKPELTGSRAILLGSFRNYLALGDDITLLVAQKLAYFIQRFGEDLRLKFEKGWYGPYAHNLNHVLKVLNGYYIFYNTDNNNPNVEIELNYDTIPEIDDYLEQEINDEQKIRMNLINQLIDGFETPLSIELLGAIDFIIQNKKTFDIDEIESDISNWTRRKKDLMKPYYIHIAFDRLMEFEEFLYPYKQTLITNSSDN